MRITAQIWSWNTRPAVARPGRQRIFGGLDGFRSVVSIEDALAGDLLLAEHLDGGRLDGDHGAPVRLVSPNQYGYISVKHLCSIKLHTVEPKGVHRSLALRLKAHPRARVWEEERHRHFPGWSVRRLYRLVGQPLLRRSARGSGPSG